MSINQIVSNQIVSIEKATRKPMYRILAKEMEIGAISTFKVADLRKLAKAMFVEGIQLTTSVNVYGVETVDLSPIYKDVVTSESAKKVKTVAQALSILSFMAKDNSIVDEISYSMVNGVSLATIAASPEKYVKAKFVPTIKEFFINYNVDKVTTPTREMGLVWTAELATSKLQNIDGNEEVVVVPRLELRSQNDVMDKLATQRVMINRNERTGDVIVLSTEQANIVLTQGAIQKDNSFIYADRRYTIVRDLRYIMTIDYNMPLLEGAKELSRLERKIQDTAIKNGVMFEFFGEMLRANYWMQSPSQERQVFGNHIVGMDPIVAMHKIGMDMRQFAKWNGEKYVIDMSKAPKRFGLSLSSSIKSNLIKIGNEIVEYSKDEYAIVGGTHTMLCTNDVYSYVKTGEYMAYDMESETYKTLNASEFPVYRNVTDGMIFCDFSVIGTLYAEFGKLTSAVQVRITPATKGLVIFVPGLKKAVGHDIMAFKSATKGDYRTLLRTNPDFQIDFRIAKMNKNSRDVSNQTNMPYQMIQTLDINFEDLKTRLIEKIQDKLEMYDDNEKLAKYLGLNALEGINELSSEELSEQDNELLDATLVSMFSKYLYTSDIVTSDPYFKKKILDIVQNSIREWASGTIPVEGHYRFVSTDVYGVLEAYKMGSYAIKHNYKSEFVEYDKEGNAANIVVPSQVGIPANHVVMVDDNDKYFLDGKTIISQRNPKMSSKETARVTTIIMSDYYKARKQFKFAFNNLIFFSCHDIKSIMQGGLDFDGDTVLASGDELLVNSYVYRPAFLQMNIDKKGNMIEGCPWKGNSSASYVDFDKADYRSDVFVNGVQMNNEFKVTFTDADYDVEFARQLHELAKVMTLRSLQPNQIGLITDFATKILSAISRLKYHIANNIDVYGKELTAEVKAYYLNEIADMEVKVDKLAAAQGYEIDKAKHGGEFWEHFDLRFIQEPEHFPPFACEFKQNPNGEITKRYLKLEWMTAARTKDCFQTLEGYALPSFMQHIRNLVLYLYKERLEQRFLKMDAADGNFNLINAFSPYVDANDHNEVNSVYEELTPIFKKYGEGQKSIIALRERFAVQRIDFAKKHNSNRKALEMYDRNAKYEINLMMDKVVTSAQKAIKTLSAGASSFDEATVAYLAYCKKYNNYNHTKANELNAPAMGLSFPWVICQDGMLELLARVSNKEINHSAFKPIETNAQKIRICGFDNVQMSIEQIQSLVNSVSDLDVLIQEDPLTKNVMPFVYAGNTIIGFVASDYMHFLSGSDKFAFKFMNFTPSNSGKSAEVYMTEVYRK